MGEEITGFHYLCMKPCVLFHFQMSADPESYAKEVIGRNNPWIGEFVAEDGDPMYFLFIEQQVLFSVNTFSRALFCGFSTF